MKVISDRRVWLGLFVFLFFIAAFGPSYGRVAQAAAPPQPQVLQSDTNHIVLELDIPNYDSSKQSVGSTTYTVLAVPGFGNTGVVGKPQLPIKGTMIGIPPGAQVTLQILVDKSSSVTLSQPPIPIPSTVVKSDYRQPIPTDQSKKFTPDPAFYSSDQFYPERPADIASVGDWRSQRTASVEFHPFQYNAATRQLVFHQQLQVELVFSYPNGLTGQAVGSPVDEGAFDKVFQKGLANYSSAKNWRSNNRAALAPEVAPAFYAGTPWYKIGVNADGIYQVTCGKIAVAAGKSLNIAPSKLQLFKNGQEAAIKVVGTTWGSCTSSDSSDYIEFYGQAPKSKYTNTNIYWLTYGKATGKRMGAADNTGTAAMPSSFTDIIHLEENHYYESNLPLTEGADHWYWTLSSGAFGLNPNFQFSLDGLNSGTFTANVKADLTSFTTLGHHTQLLVNGKQVGELIWSGQHQQNLSFDFLGSWLNLGANTIQVVEPNDQDPGDIIFVNSLDVSYQRVFAVTNDSLQFSQSGSGIWRYRLSGFTNSNLEAFDVTNPFQVAKFNTLTITPSNSTFTLSFIDSITSPHRYIGLTSAQRLSPTSVTLDSPSNLHATTNGADYIIISYGGFIGHIAPLANYRAGQGLRVKVVDVQDAYDEFADGLPDPQGIHDFLAYAYANWQGPAPSYVLLVGDGHYDPKGYCIPPATCQFVVTTPNTEFIPPYLLMVDPFIGETDSDNRFVAFNSNNTLPDMAIGRLPANSNTEVDAMVAKILNYEQNPPPGTWQTAVTFVADKPDPNAGDFAQQSDLVALNPTYMPAPYTSNRIYYPNATYPDSTSAHQAILQAIDAGSLIVNYTGHGCNTCWAQPVLFNTGDIGPLTNGTMTPVMVDMTCLTGLFDWPGVPSLAETILVRTNGGAVASWAATGDGISTGHYLLDEGFFNAVMQQGVYQLGPATILGKANLWANSGGAFHDLIDTFQLFGDPATRMLASQADVAISKTVSSNGPLPLGSPITFQLTFANNGAGRAEKVVISDILPAGIINSNYTSTGVPITPTGNKPFVWNVGSLDPGAGGVITINGTLSPDPNTYASFTLTNTATISTPTQQTDTSNDQSSTVTQAVETLFLPFIIH